MSCPILFYSLGVILLPLSLLAATDHPVKCSQAQPYHGPALRGPVALPSTEELAVFPVGKFPPALEENLSAALALAHSKTQAPVITAAVAVPGGGFWSATRTLDPLAVAPEYLYWASAGKAFTSVLIHQLIEEGKLTLTTPIARWFPDYPNAEVITIEHLLTHTSGIFSFNHDLKFRAQARSHTPAELIAFAKKHGNSFCPGELWSYSNTGFLMLGIIVEKLDGCSYADAVDARIVRRLGLAHTKALTSITDRAEIAQPHPTDPVETKVAVAFNLPYGAGCIVASAEDMVRFWHGLLAGKLLSPATVTGMFSTLYPMFDQRVSFYGRGVMVSDIPDQFADVWIGHSGGTPGIKAEIIYSQKTHAFVAVALTSDGSAQSTVNLLLKTLRGEPLPSSEPTGAKPK